VTCTVYTTAAHKPATTTLVFDTGTDTLTTPGAGQDGDTDPATGEATTEYDVTCAAGGSGAHVTCTPNPTAVTVSNNGAGNDIWARRYKNAAIACLDTATDGAYTGNPDACGVPVEIP
jgi:hypothetical protein